MKGSERLKLTCSVLIGKSVQFFLRIFTKNSGTSLPGLLIFKIMPSVLSLLVKQIPNRIVVTGTNGKTSTQNIIASILREQSSLKVLNNATGSNMIQGLITTLISAASTSGNLDFTHLIFEIEEGTLPRIIESIDPNIIIVTNIFRDQLDAYGEIEITKGYIQSAIQKAPKAKVILNLDDTFSSSIASSIPNEIYYVTLPEDYREEINYESGAYSASVNPGQIRNKLSASNIEIKEDLTNRFTIQGMVNKKSVMFEDIPLNSIGFFQIYNALFATTVAILTNIGDQGIRDGLEAFKPAFGRGEDIVYEKNGKKINFKLILTKNPAGISVTLKVLKNLKDLKLGIILNDLIADGKDISWIWDSNFEILNECQLTSLYLSGTRRHDLMTRVKYAIEEQSMVEITPSLNDLIEKAHEAGSDGDTFYILSTYTGMLKFRSELGKTL